MSELEGKIALVTGGASGIGRAAVQLLAERGAAVVFCDISPDAVQRVSSELADAGSVVGQVVGQVVDVTDEASVAEFVSATVARHGGLDIVVTAAGIQRYGIAAETTSALWDEVLAVNVKGCFNAVKHALPHLRQRRGAVVLVSSVQAFVAQNNAAAYVTSKGALNALARSLAVDEAEYGVRANVICPGSVDTAMLRASARQFSDGTAAGEAAMLDQWGKMHPLGRIATAREVAEAIVFLGSDRASFITGVSLPVDGGLLATVAVNVV